MRRGADLAAEDVAERPAVELAHGHRLLPRRRVPLPLGDPRRRRELLHIRLRSVREIRVVGAQLLELRGGGAEPGGGGVEAVGLLGLGRLEPEQRPPTEQALDRECGLDA